MDWGGFEQAAPELAAQVRRAFARFGFALVATIRRDGTPRLSPVEWHCVGGHLMLVMIPHTRKVHDLDRDSRVLVQTPVTESEAPEDEAALRGRVHDISDTAHRGATAAAIEASSGWRPRDSWRYFAVDIESASCKHWDGEDMRLLRWDEAGGARPPQRLRLDMTAGRYRPTLP
ncbi:pyridoxamine 5'-phosphate oxidase family protein [Nocardia wallacei]|uniref:pyridoxamine 5'-phosphate oxidase family protein n=1 Tax=Nocardia wallacei TaxID=480035 RepID=UPI002458C797|nr:pyridoxamine 5'-phosphate oxidase family protein [Nocardia wallacei]